MLNLRDDILISVCFSDANAPKPTHACLAALVEILKARYRYWEILIVNEAGLEEEFEETLMALPNLRYLSVAQGLDDSQRRLVAASEAIGDIVVITSLQEVDTMDIPAMIEEANANDAVILGLRRATAAAEPLIIALGRASGFQASTRDMKTVAFPRTALNRLLSHPNPVLAIRFPPRDSSLSVLRKAQSKDTTRTTPPIQGRSARAFSRLDLLMRMVTEAGPSILGAVALLSVVISISAFLFAIYVVIVYFTKADIAEGWTTLSLAISGMLGFLGITLFAISITLRKVAETTRGGATDYLIAEHSSVDLFESVAHALNVDTDDRDHQELPAEPLEINAPSRSGRNGA
ncbi:hypothetical protein RA27_18125 [Ruegeria sp. ANG-R]|uniref:hypothetical protein n=1 Tax=Ruegeria sp. ANG-R TaxID=1577903 RepID=UPI00057E0F2C|nr:hypothetical protein [Ruegeria sp. ANG-R]KIC39062.1 hypothetical protein RA27_18125 [Ruegeria sp. ANG-R]